MTERLADDEAAVADSLRSRPASAAPAGFADRMAARLDGESGWLGAADWRWWALGTAPAAAVLLVGAVMLGGGRADSSVSLVSATETWASGDRTDGRPASSILWKDGVTGDTLLLVVLAAAGPDDLLDETPADGPGGLK
jgi:hypothetical protein